MTNPFSQTRGRDLREAPDLMCWGRGGAAMGAHKALMEEGESSVGAERSALSLLK